MTVLGVWAMQGIVRPRFISSKDDAKLVSYRDSDKDARQAKLSFMGILKGEDVTFVRLSSEEPTAT
jgi:hypothetical protein